MRKFLIIPALAFALGGCAQMQAISGGLSLATKSISNPVTQTEEAQVELAITTALTALNTYKEACKQGNADKHCADNIAQIQPYTRQIKILVNQLRNFVDNNDQINATVVYNQLTALYGNAKQIAANLGIKLGDSTI